MPYKPDPIFNDTLDTESRATSFQMIAVALMAMASLLLCVCVVAFLVVRRVYGLPERTFQLAMKRLA